MKYILCAFLVSFFLNILFIHFSASFFYDNCNGIQKFHSKPVPRVGGISIYSSVLVSNIMFFLSNKYFAKDLFYVFLCSFPVFAAGLLEDLTKRIKPRWRLFAGFFSGLLACIFLKVYLKKLEIPGFDFLLNFPLFSVFFTIFALSGVSHAFNIIDGLNGLSSGIAIIIFGSYSYVSFVLNDYFLLYLSLVMLFSILGFFVWNYPFGFIFLGDGGAYFIGYIIALTGLLLVTNNPQVSPWFPFVLVLYPVWETIFSIYRRKFLKGVSPSIPDALHFHTLIFRRLIKFTFGTELEVFKRNSLASSYLWVLELLCASIGVLFWKRTYILFFFSLIFIFFYTWLYFRIIKFRTPKFLILKFNFKDSN